MDIGDYYSKAINGFTKNPLLAVPTGVGYVLIYVIMFVVMFVGFLGIYGFNPSFFSQYSTSAMNTMDLSTLSMFLGIFLVIIAIVAIISWIISCIMQAATIGMSKRILLGEKPDLGDALHYVKKYLIKLLAVSFIFGVLVFIVCIPLGIGVGLIAAYPNNDLIILGPIIGGLITLLLLVGLFLFFIFTFQSVIVGKKSIIGSFKDSYKTVRGNLFEVVGVLVINLVIILAIGVVLFIINLILALIPIIGSILYIIIGIIVYSIIYPYLTLVLNYLYMDLKNMIPEEAEYVY